MATIISINLAKKVPLAGVDYASKSASVTINSEVIDLAQIPAEVKRLFAIVERTVDEQLGLISASAPAVRSPEPQATSSSSPQPTVPRPTQASAPYRANPQRRGPAPITDSQLRFIDRLMVDSKTNLNALLQHHQVGSLRDLSCKQGAALIDELKSGVAA